ncbi:MAG: VirE protein [Mediterranea massiliensis]|nr:VirE protein [Mediterranea massiliensis]
MNFGIGNNVKSRVVRTCTPELFHQAVDSRKVAQVCAEIADAREMYLRGELTKEEFETKKVELKKRLPILTPHATFKNERRLNAEAIPSGMSMYDLDHIPNPQERWAEIAPRKEELGIVLAHITPSTEGLRLFFIMPQGMNLGEAQAWMAKQLGDTTYDVCVKDYARSSFLVPREYLLFVDEERLFSEEMWTDSDKGLVISEETANHSSLTAKHSNTFPTTYKGVPYSEILHAIAEELGGEPEEGERNAKVLRMASSLRHICDNNAEWLMEIIPTYGLPEEEWKKTIQNACKDGLKYGTTKVLQAALAKLKIKNEKLNDEESLIANHSSLTAPKMPTKLPSLIKLLTKNVPQEMKAAVAHAIFPALGAHLNGVRFRYVDNVEHEATFMCVLLAKQSSGKSAVNKPIEYILADIRERDAYNREREQAWKDSLNSKGSNKEKPKRPDDLCIQILSADMTNAAFVQRLADAKGKFLYTQMDEIELLDQLKTSGKGNNVSQIIRLAFDCGLYGQERVGSQSVTAQVRLRWNWNASSTIQNGREFFRKSLTNGTLSRLNFCTIEPSMTDEIPVYGTYDDDFARKLKPYIDRLNMATGLVECDKAVNLAKQLQKENAETAALSDDEAFDVLSRRANVIAYLKAMTLYIAENKWTKEIEEFIRWSEEYDLWCKMHFFGEELNAKINQEYISVHRGPRNLLEQLPDCFTKKQAEEVIKRNGKKSTPSHILSMWKNRKYIYLNDEGLYVKQKK